jgi:ABC-type uncharacterized transport system permease subunit
MGNLSPDLLTTLSLTALTARAHPLTHHAIRYDFNRPNSPANPRYQHALLIAIALGTLALFAYRAARIHHGWQPLQAHVDGLLLIVPLFIATVLFLEYRAHIAGLTLFSIPTLTLILAWAICASHWTFHTFRIDSFWKTTHLASVYLGTLFFIIAAIAGAMFLYIQRGLQRKNHPANPRNIASLETAETLIIRSSAMGFALLTLGLIMGLILATAGPSKLGPGWWHSKIVIFATAAWLVFGIVTNVRHTSLFRGKRAAWLSLVGLLLLLATFAAVNALPDPDPSLALPTTHPKENAP